MNPTNLYTRLVLAQMVCRPAGHIPTQSIHSGTPLPQDLKALSEAEKKAIGLRLKQMSADSVEECYTPMQKEAMTHLRAACAGMKGQQLTYLQVIVSQLAISADLFSKKAEFLSASGIQPIEKTISFYNGKVLQSFNLIEKLMAFQETKKISEVKEVLREVGGWLHQVTRRYTSSDAAFKTIQEKRALLNVYSEAMEHPEILSLFVRPLDDHEASIHHDSSSSIYLLNEKKLSTFRGTLLLLKEGLKLAEKEFEKDRVKLKDYEDDAQAFFSGLRNELQSLESFSPVDLLKLQEKALQGDLEAAKKLSSLLEKTMKTLQALVEVHNKQFTKMQNFQRASRTKNKAAQDFLQNATIHLQEIARAPMIMGSAFFNRLIKDLKNVSTWATLLPSDVPPTIFATRAEAIFGAFDPEHREQIGTIDRRLVTESVFAIFAILESVAQFASSRSPSYQNEAFNGFLSSAKELHILSRILPYVGRFPWENSGIFSLAYLSTRFGTTPQVTSHDLPLLNKLRQNTINELTEYTLIHELIAEEELSAEQKLFINRLQSLATALVPLFQQPFSSVEALQFSSRKCYEIFNTATEEFLSIEDPEILEGLNRFIEPIFNARHVQLRPFLEIGQIESFRVEKKARHRRRKASTSPPPSPPRQQEAATPSSSPSRSPVVFSLDLFRALPKAQQTMDHETQLITNEAHSQMQFIVPQLVEVMIRPAFSPLLDAWAIQQFSALSLEQAFTYRLSARPEKTHDLLSPAEKLQIGNKDSLLPIQGQLQQGMRPYKLDQPLSIKTAKELGQTALLTLKECFPDVTFPQDFPSHTLSENTGQLDHLREAYADFLTLHSQSHYLTVTNLGAPWQRWSLASQLKGEVSDMGVHIAILEEAIPQNELSYIQMNAALQNLGLLLEKSLNSILFYLPVEGKKDEHFAFYQPGARPMRYDHHLAKKLEKLPQLPLSEAQKDLILKMASFAQFTRYPAGNKDEINQLLQTLWEDATSRGKLSQLLKEGAETATALLKYSAEIRN